VGGVQLAAVFQSLLIGFMLQVALSALTAFSAPSENVTTVAQDRMGDFMAAIMPMAPFKRKTDSPPPCTSRVDSPAAFDTGVFPVDNSASRRCEMQCALFLNV